MVLDDSDTLAAAPFIVTLDCDGNLREARVRMAEQISQGEIRALFGDQIAWHDTCEWSKRDRRVVSRKQERFGAIVLDDQVWKDVPPEAVAEAMLDGVRDLGLRLSGAAARLAARKPSRLARWFWGIVVALIGAVVSVTAWDFATGLIVRLPLLGWAVTVGLAVALVLALLMGLRELAALARLQRVDGLRRSAADVGDDLKAANAYSTRLDRFYAGRDDLSWGRARLAERRGELLDADAVLDLSLIHI